MKEIEAKAIMDAYNKLYKDKVTLKQVQDYLATHAFFNLPAELVAKLMHDKTLD